MNTVPKIWTRETGLIEKRDLWSAMKRGFRGRCPRCGEGKLFRAFLKTVDNCSACGLDFTPHRADDLPASPPAIGAEVDHPIRRTDHVEIVLDDQQAAAVLDQPLEA